MLNFIQNEFVSLCDTVLLEALLHTAVVSTVASQQEGCRFNALSWGLSVWSLNVLCVPAWVKHAHEPSGNLQPRDRFKSPVSCRNESSHRTRSLVLPRDAAGGVIMTFLIKVIFTANGYNSVAGSGGHLLP